MGRRYNYRPLIPFLQKPEPVPDMTEPTFGPSNLNAEMTIFQQTLIRVASCDGSDRKKKLQTINKSIRKTCWTCSKRDTDENYLRPYSEVYVTCFD